jgi:hypothetical protein
MPEEVVVFKHGERFATMSKNGKVRIWTVGENGLPTADPEAPPYTSPSPVRGGGAEPRSTKLPPELRP